MNYPYGMWGPGWGQQAPMQQPYPVFIPQPGPNGRPPKGRSLRKQFNDWKEFQELMNGGKKPDEKKKDDGPKVAMIPIPLALFFGVLLSPAVGPIVYLCYKSLWTMALGH